MRKFKRIIAAAAAAGAMTAMSMGLAVGVAGAATTYQWQSKATVAITGGTLSFTKPAAIHFKDTLNGKAVTGLAMTGGTEAFKLDDATGSGAGWNMELTSTTFASHHTVTVSGTETTEKFHTLPTDTAYIPSTQTTAYTCTTAGSCTVGTNSVTYAPLTVPAATTTAPAAVPIFNAAATTGMGAQSTAVAFDINLPANVYSGNYSSDWIFTLFTGP